MKTNSPLHLVTKNSALVDTMRTAIRDSKLNEVRGEEKWMQSFAFCQDERKVSSSVVTKRTAKDVNIPDECAQGNPIGLFYVQDYPNSETSSRPVISRDVLKVAFVESGYKVVCAGYGQGIIDPAKRTVEYVPKILCVAPKQGATKDQIVNTIQNLDATYDMIYGLKSKPYIHILRHTFDTQRLGEKRSKKDAR